MNEKLAKGQLLAMLDRFTVGSVLHLLADIQREHAKQAKAAGDAIACERSKMLEHTLFVVGLGIDTANPQ